MTEDIQTQEFQIHNMLYHILQTRTSMHDMQKLCWLMKNRHMHTTVWILAPCHGEISWTCLVLCWPHNATIMSGWHRSKRGHVGYSRLYLLSPLCGCQAVSRSIVIFIILWFWFLHGLHKNDMMFCLVNVRGASSWYI